MKWNENRKLLPRTGIIHEEYRMAAGWRIRPGPDHFRLVGERPRAQLFPPPHVLRAACCVLRRQTREGEFIMGVDENAIGQESGISMQSRELAHLQPLVA